MSKVMLDVQAEKRFQQVVGTGHAGHRSDMVRVDPAHPADYHVQAAFHGLGVQFPVHVRVRPVVTVTVDYIIARSDFHAPAAAVSPAAVDVVAKDLHLAPALRELIQYALQYLHGCVRGAVVHEHIFDVFHGLAKESPGTPFNVLLNLVDQDYDTYGRHHFFFLEKGFEMPCIPRSMVRCPRRCIRVKRLLDRKAMSTSGYSDM